MKEIIKWYLIHTYSGYEKKVKTDLEKRIQSLELEDKVFRIMVPEEEVEVEKRGKKVSVLRKIFPSYVMVEMLTQIVETETTLMYKVDSRAWYVVRNTNGVTGFLGVGSDPIPMSDEEVEEIFRKINYVGAGFKPFNIGDRVRILTDSFLGAESVIEDINEEEATVKVLVDLFNRPTAIYLKYNEVEKI